MERLAESVAGELRRFGPGTGMAAIVSAWPAAVGAGIARNAWPARLARDGTLHVHADSSAWAFELAQLAPALLERLRETVGEAAPRALRFAVGRVPAPPAEPRAEAGSERAAPTAEDRDRAAAIAAAIADPELRRLVARAAAASLAHGASDRRF